MQGSYREEKDGINQSRMNSEGKTDVMCSRENEFTS